MDPLSITASCVGITAGIATLAEKIIKFISTVREARKDLDAVRRELGSLQLSLSALSDEDKKFDFNGTPVLKENLIGVLGNCGGIVVEIRDILESMEGSEDGKVGIGKRMKWATSGKGQMEKVRGQLEAHKSALDIALDLIAISITADIKQDTMALRGDTSRIKEDTDQILHEIGNLQNQVANLDISNERGYLMKRFLESSVTYTESVANLDELESFPPSPTQAPLEVIEDEPLSSRLPLAQSTDPRDIPSPRLTATSRATNSYWTTLTQQRKDLLLLEAVADGNPKRILLLLEAGANIDARNGKGDTCLAVAINERRYESLQILLDSGARTDQVTASGTENAFDEAHFISDVKAMKIILDSGPDNPEHQIYYQKAVEAVDFEIFLLEGNSGRVFNHKSEPVDSTERGVESSERVQKYSSPALDSVTEKDAASKQRILFADLFRRADVDQVGVITGDVAVKFFESTRLKPRTLGEIWHICDTENRGFLTQKAFSTALRLIGHCQAGRDPFKLTELSLQPGPSPTFYGV